MPAKTNQKAVKAREMKERHRLEKEDKARLQKEEELEKSWSTGARDDSGKKENERKKREMAERKAERERLLQEEAIEMRKISCGPTAREVKARGNVKRIEEKELKIESYSRAVLEQSEAQEYSAGNLSDALELLSLTQGSKSNQPALERHPERRVKSAWAIFEEREMPLIKVERPGLKLSQYKQLLQKKWKKSPENPMNQAHIAYDSTHEEEVSVGQRLRKQVLEEMRVKNP